MAVIQTGNHPKALWPGVHAWFGMKYDEFPKEYTELFDTYPSSRNYEEEVQSTSFGYAPVKAEGAPITYDTHQQGYTVRYPHIAYGLGYVVTFEELQDNLYEKVSMSRAESLAFSMGQTPELIGANVYNRAFNSSYTGGDGKELLATDHPLTGGGTFSNELDPAADLSEASLEDMVIQIHGAVNDRNMKIKLMPKTLIIPRQEIFNATRILKSAGQNDTANNAINALKSMNAIPGGVVMNHYLTDADAWFIRTNAPHGMKHFERNGLIFDKDNDFATKNALASAYMRFSFKWTDPRGLYGSAGA